MGNACGKKKRFDATPTPTPTPTPAAPAMPSVPPTKEMFDVALKVDSLVSGETMVTIEPPAKGTRVPLDICCVVDVSGSMSTEATLKNADGSAESHGLSVLDVAKHSVKTIVQMLKPHDRLSLVTYSTSASVVMSLRAMDDAGKTKAETEVKNMQTESSTNIWAGLTTGLNDLKTGSMVNGKKRYQCILLLTDGQPNISPPRGEPAMLQQFQDQNPDMKCVVHTFGFGYNLNTQLLQSLAEVGGGSFSFIPDASLVGTVFVNATSNILVTQSHHAKLRLTPLNGAAFADGPLLSGLPKALRSKKDKESVVVDVGAVHFGQRNQVMLNMKFGDKDKPHLKVELECTPAVCFESNEPKRFAQESSAPVDEHKEITAQVARYLAVDCITTVINAMNTQDNPKVATDTVAATVAKIRKLPHDVAHRDPRVADTCKDLLGQVKEAVGRREFFQRWGRHYLPSLAQAHLQQCCNNFKDPGVQHYGGEDFGDQRDIADEIFCKMPPPKPSSPKTTYGYSGSAPAAAPVASMRTYYNCNSGCFHGKCVIAMADGSYKPLREVRRGDRVLTGAGAAATVACVTRTPTTTTTTTTTTTKGVMRLVQVPKTRLLATPYHPVRVDGQWVFPCHLSSPRAVECAAVYNLLLSDHHASMVIEGVECVSLGHGLAGKVVGHEYFGDRQAVISDLEKMPGWSRGVVDLRADDFVRDPNTNKVVAIRRSTHHASKQHQQPLDNAVAVTASH